MPSSEKDFETPAAKEAGLPQPRQPLVEAGLSLDDLNAAFAGMLSDGHDPYREALPAEQAAMPQDIVAVDVFEEEDASCPITPLTILEAILFVGSSGADPLTSQRVASMMRGVRPAEIDDLVRDLNERYGADGRPYRIECVDEGYRLTLRDEYSAVVDKLQGRNRQARLSPAAVEVLSLIAYNGPQTAEELARLRGRPSGAVLSQLVRRQLLRIERNAEDRRVTRYVTTPRFLSALGIESLDDLPRGHDVEQR